MPREQLREARGAGWENVLGFGIVGRVILEPFMPQGWLKVSLRPWIKQSNVLESLAVVVSD
jgi:hypothetical protein